MLYSSGPSTQKPDSEETGGAVGLPRSQWSDVDEVSKASGPDEEKENEQDAADKDRDTPQPTV